MQTYVMQVQRQNGPHVVAATRDFSLTFGAKGRRRRRIRPGRAPAVGHGVLLADWGAKGGLAVAGPDHRDGGRDEGRAPKQPAASGVGAPGITAAQRSKRPLRLAESLKRNSAVGQTLAPAIPAGTVARIDGTASV